MPTTPDSGTRHFLSPEVQKRPVQDCGNLVEAVFGTTEMVQHELRNVQAHLQLIKLRVGAVKGAGSRVSRAKSAPAVLAKLQCTRDSRTGAGFSGLVLLPRDLDRPAGYVVVHEYRYKQRG